MITINQIKELGFKYDGIIPLRCSYPIHKFSVEWSQCPPEAKCNDHFYGEYIIYGEVLGRSETIPYIKIEIIKKGGFIGMNQKRIAFDGHIDNIDQLKTLFEILYIKKSTFL